ncbi:hypothetical protein K5I29_01120 [Flavobacterium agricola]|uniref:Uncharacterized protein n=1 Tax=Flavobacterium agricola TaxID=2870839 RepID=A0ABY6LZ97_9FLAO|nr:hypothetical protein [Flavobacterium agricola]UYW01559.1 hypothetical protein K5I29_01120 [Flavobacterium agricola]
MSELSEVTVAVQYKLNLLLRKMKALEEINESLLAEIQQSEDEVLRQIEVIENLQKQNESLRIANSLLGSADFKRETKLKINSIIKEIDYCIEHLSE